LRIKTKLAKKCPIKRNGRQLMYMKRGITKRPVPLARLIWFIVSAETQIRAALRQSSSILHAACEDGCGHFDCTAGAHLRAGSTTANAEDRELDVMGRHRNRGLHRGDEGRFIAQSTH
jgi:hypothetical protein